MARILMRQISEPAVKLEPCKLYMYVCIKKHTHTHGFTCTHALNGVNFYPF